MITHVVLFKLIDRSPDNIARTKDVLMSMEGKISELLHIEAGTDVLCTERSYDLALITKFHSLDDLQAYQVHPVHKEIIAYIATVKESNIAVDYES